MSYTRITLMILAAKEAFDNGELTLCQYDNLLDDLSEGIIKVDVKKSSTDFKELIAFYAK